MTASIITHAIAKINTLQGVAWRIEPTSPKIGKEQRKASKGESGMRLLHFSDAHFGAEIYGRRDPQTGMHTHLQDFLRCLDFLVEEAASKGVDAVLFTGDAYHHPRPKPLPQREFLKRILVLSERNIPVLLLAGNHDLPPEFGEASPLDILTVFKLPGVHFVRHPKVASLPTKRGELQVVCFPYLSRTTLISVDEEQVLGDEEKVRREMEKRVSQSLQKMLRQVPEGNGPTVLMGHIWVYGAQFAGSEKVLSPLREPLVAPSALRHQRFTYIALGHIHRHQILEEFSSPIVYAGSLGRLDFGEENEEKGFYLVDLEQTPKGQWGVKDLQFIPTPTRSFVTVDLDLRNEPNPTQVAEQRLREDPRLNGAVVRVFLRIKEEQRPLLHLPRLRELLEKRADHLAALRDELDTPPATPLPVDPRNPHEVERLFCQNPVELLRQWLDERAKEDKELVERKERLLSAAQKLWREMQKAAH